MSSALVDAPNAELAPVSAYVHDVDGNSAAIDPPPLRQRRGVSKENTMFSDGQKLTHELARASAYVVPQMAAHSTRETGFPPQYHTGTVRPQFRAPAGTP